MADLMEPIQSKIATLGKGHKGLREYVCTVALCRCTAGIPVGLLVPRALLRPRQRAPLRPHAPRRALLCPRAFPTPLAMSAANPPGPTLPCTLLPRSMENFATLKANLFQKGMIDPSMFVVLRSLASHLEDGACVHARPPAHLRVLREHVLPGAPRTHARSVPPVCLRCVTARACVAKCATHTRTRAHSRDRAAAFDTRVRARAPSVRRAGACRACRGGAPPHDLRMRANPRWLSPAGGWLARVQLGPSRWCSTKTRSRCLFRR